MASPQFGVHVILPQYGNASSGGYINGSPPAIDHRIYTGLPQGATLPPNLTRPPRMPIIEKITPRTMNATAMRASQFGQARANAAKLQRKSVQFMTGYLRALKTRQGFTMNIGTPLTTATHLPIRKS